MKSEIFQSAIKTRKRIRFLYGLDEVILEPYYISNDKRGRKVLYGRVNGSHEIRKFEYKQICNIKVLNINKFSPIIPILSAWHET